MTFYRQNVGTSLHYIHGDVMSLNSYKEVQNGGTVEIKVHMISL